MRLITPARGDAVLLVLVLSEATRKENVLPGEVMDEVDEVGRRGRH